MENDGTKFYPKNSEPISDSDHRPNSNCRNRRQEKKTL